MSYKGYINEETYNQALKRRAHTITWTYTRGKPKLVCSCGAQSKLGNTNLHHNVI